DQLLIDAENMASAKKRIADMRTIDCQRDSISRQYTRSCGVCFTENPTIRASYNCGHIVCLPCAEEQSISNGGEKKCPFCRKDSIFVRLFEEEKTELDEDNGAENGKDVPPTGNKRNSFSDEERDAKITDMHTIRAAERHLVSLPDIVRLVRNTCPHYLELMLLSEAIKELIKETQRI
ncbi:hypothetical protein PFISCL1PPCAC_3019, partial [Pristionchus fissidentatus]